MYYVQCSPAAAGLAVCGAVSCFGHVLSILASIYTHCVVEPWPGQEPRSPALYVLHVRVLVTRGRHRAVATEVPVTVPLHAWSGQPLVTGPSLVTISSQLVRDPIVIITRSPASSMAKKAGGRRHTSHTCGPLRNLRPEFRFQILYHQHPRCRSVCCLISLRQQP